MKIIILILLISVIFIAGCQSYKAKDGLTAQQTAKSLSEMQATACSTANDAGTCDIRLPELGIVLKEDCCKALGKCC